MLALDDSVSCSWTTFLDHLFVFWTTFLDRETTNFFLPSPGSDFFFSKMNKERYLQKIRSVWDDFCR